MPWQDYTLSWDSEISVIGLNSSEVVVFNNFSENNTWYYSRALEFERFISGAQKNLPIKQRTVHETWEVGNTHLKIPTKVLTHPKIPKKVLTHPPQLFQYSSETRDGKRRKNSCQKGYSAAKSICARMLRTAFIYFCKRSRHLSREDSSKYSRLTTKAVKKKSNCQ